VRQLARHRTKVVAAINPTRGNLEFKMLRRAALVGLCLVSINGFAAAACLKANTDNQTAQGQLTIGRAQDAAGRPERPYILQLQGSACLDADDPDDAVKSTRTIHVFPANEALQPTFRRLVGKTVVVYGNPFPAMTAHHHAPIVMQVTHIDAP
jgi:hypothetical protein